MLWIHKIRHQLYTYLATALTLVAVFVVNTASPVFVYSGETPEELLE